jgi:hypothetical protein
VSEASFDIVYYGSLLPLLAAYLLSYRPYRIGGVSAFFLYRNMSVLYFAIFSILLGKFVYEGSTLVSADFNESLYFLMWYYAIVLMAVAAYFNRLPQRDLTVSATRLNAVPLLLALAVKLALGLVDTTPMQELILNGFAAAHLKQFDWHQPGAGGFVKAFYVYFGPAMCVLFTVYFRLTRSFAFRLLLAALIFETSGFYFSKSGLIVPLIVLLVLAGVRLRFVVVCFVAALVGAFYLRAAEAPLLSGELLDLIGERLVAETGYANPQLELYSAEGPPIGYESRYYIGLNSLFGIEPAVDASREAYLLEKGRSGATSSGHAAVSLYAFWGPAFYLVLPFLVAFVFALDRQIQKRLRTTFGLVAYVFIGFKAVNYLTVDIQRLVSFQTVIDPTLLVSVLVVTGLGWMLRLRAFCMPITLFGRPRRPASQGV